MPSDDVPEIPMVDPEDRLPTSAPRNRSRASRGGTSGGRSLLPRLLPILIVVVALGGFVGLVGYYYMAAESNGGVAPLIKADQQPFKVKPDNPGGMTVPYQDKEIYDRMGHADESSVPPPNTERLLPPPETPLPRPEAPAAPPATTASAPPAPTTAATPNTNSNVGGAAKPRTPTLSAAPPGGTPPAPVTSAPAPQQPPSPPTAVATVATKPPAAAPARPAAPPPAPAPAPTKAAAVAPPHPAAKPESSGGPVLRVAIASVRTEADARLEWERQRRMYPDALAGISPSYASIDLHDKGVYWRIYVGPPEPGSEARARCEVLKRKKVDCFVARP